MPAPDIIEAELSPFRDHDAKEEALQPKKRKKSLTDTDPNIRLPLDRRMAPIRTGLRINWGLLWTVAVAVAGLIATAAVTANDTRANKAQVEKVASESVAIGNRTTALETNQKNLETSVTKLESAVKDGFDKINDKLDVMMRSKTR
jgi:hypothetical protein